jgi:hypothetical protein
MISAPVSFSLFNSFTAFLNVQKDIRTRNLIQFKRAGAVKNAYSLLFFGHWESYRIVHKKSQKAKRHDIDTTVKA